MAIITIFSGDRFLSAGEANAGSNGLSRGCCVGPARLSVTELFKSHGFRQELCSECGLYSNAGVSGAALCALELCFADQPDDVLPDVPSAVFRASALLLWSPTLDHRKLEFSGCVTMTGW
ncbi:hypothetical protein [Leisingera methylohalidivorans]|uniref:hypothetical protein n=1 Tax=Leisingera methylohalidivorans TaxID=133924 RepID=UPI00146FAFA0|nr:hypothetical protein [Leisingera methylohalidivorans]